MASKPTQLRQFSGSTCGKSQDFLNSFSPEPDISHESRLLAPDPWQRGLFTRTQWAHEEYLIVVICLKYGWHHFNFLTLKNIFKKTSLFFTLSLILTLEGYAFVIFSIYLVFFNAFHTGHYIVLIYIIN